MAKVIADRAAVAAEQSVDIAGGRTLVDARSVSADDSCDASAVATAVTSPAEHQVVPSTPTYEGGEITGFMTERDKSERGLVYCPSLPTPALTPPLSSSSSSPSLPGTSTNQIQKIVRTRHTAKDTVEFLVQMGAGDEQQQRLEWVAKEQLASQPDLALAYFMSSDFDRMVMSRNVLPLLYSDTGTHSQPLRCD